MYVVLDIHRVGHEKLARLSFCTCPCYCVTFCIYAMLRTRAVARKRPDPENAVGMMTVLRAAQLRNRASFPCCGRDVCPLRSVRSGSDFH